MPASIIDNTVCLCVTFRVACPDNKFMYPFELREGNTEDPVYAWTMELGEAKVWTSMDDPQLSRCMSKYPAAEFCYLARLRPMEPRIYGHGGTYMVEEKRKQHGMF